MELFNHSVRTILAVTLSAVSAHSAASALVYHGTNGLEYAGYANAGQTNAVNTVPDFSNAGYQGGGVSIPFIPAAVTVSNGPGDDTTLIQDAIHTVSALPMGANGFRGAVLLQAGDYTVASPLSIFASGVVIRGAGSQDSGGTRITYTATTQSNLFEVDGSGSPSEVGGTRQTITDAYVPVGARRFLVADASGFAPGDAVMIQNTVNQQWLDDMSNMSQWGWTPSSYQLKFRRTVVAVQGDEVTVDAPVVQAIETQYGGGVVYKYTFGGQLENIGFEALRLESAYASETDESHGWSAILFECVKNGWVRQVTGRYFGYSLVYIKSYSRQITVEDCAMLDPKSIITGGRRYSFNLDDSQNILVQRCLTRRGRHDFVTGSKTPGPNVFVDCRANDSYSDIGPHHRYATGQVYDNIMGEAINVQNRGSSGTGHGWAGAQIMFWNCYADSIMCDAPTGAMNWCVGSIGTQTEGGMVPGEPYGIWDSHTIPVVPRSLYYAQLEERVGPNALNRVILPEQKRADIWTELDGWGGDGLFLNSLVGWVDEDVVPEVNQPLALHGVVRDLSLLDSGTTSTWSKVSGPGGVTFADETALETTVLFDQPGSYVLQLATETAFSPVGFGDDYEADAIGAAPARAASVRPSMPLADAEIVVLNDAANRAGTGQAAHYLDDDSGTSARMEYDLVGGAAGQVSAARIEFSFARLDGASGSDWISVSAGEYGVSQTSTAKRFLDCRLVGDGTIDFRSSTSGTSDNNNVQLASNNTLVVFINDLDAASIDYAAPDGGTHSLAANSVAYWLNGAFAFSGLMENRITAQGTVMTTENNIGRWTFASTTGADGLEYVFDDVVFTSLNVDQNMEAALLSVEVMSPSAEALYAAWLALYPELGAQTNGWDDFEPDGLDNLLEYALGGNPVSNDAAATIPAWDMVDEGDGEWLYYVYERRADAAARGLAYEVVSGTNLLHGLVQVIPPFSVAPATNGFETTTHRISTETDNESFMNLEVEWLE